MVLDGYGWFWMVLNVLDVLDGYGWFWMFRMFWMVLDVLDVLDVVIKYEI